MAYWLLKTEPGDFSFGDLAREGSTAWTGVKNNQARLHMRAMREGDSALIYHSGKEKAVVGTARVMSNPYPDPRSKDAKSVVVDIRSGERLLKPFPLSEMKSSKIFAGFDLLRNSRLSVMPVSTQVWNAITKGHI